MSHELNATALQELSQLGHSLRIKLGTCIFIVRPSPVNEFALHGATNDRPWARLALHLETLSARFEGVKLIFMERYLREPGTANGAMEEARFAVYCLFIRYLAKLTTWFLSLAEATMRSLYPKLLWMLDEEHWFRALCRNC